MTPNQLYSGGPSSNSNSNSGTAYTNRVVGSAGVDGVNNSVNDASGGNSPLTLDDYTTVPATSQSPRLQQLLQQLQLQPQQSLVLQQFLQQLQPQQETQALQSQQPQQPLHLQQALRPRQLLQQIQQQHQQQLQHQQQQQEQQEQPLQPHQPHQPQLSRPGLPQIPSYPSQQSSSFRSPSLPNPSPFLPHSSSTLASTSMANSPSLQTNTTSPNLNPNSNSTTTATSTSLPKSSAVVHQDIRQYLLDKGYILPAGPPPPDLTADRFNVWLAGLPRTVSQNNEGRVQDQRQGLGLAEGRRGSQVQGQAQGQVFSQVQGQPQGPFPTTQLKPPPTSTLLTTPRSMSGASPAPASAITVTSMTTVAPRHVRAPSTSSNSTVAQRVRGASSSMQNGAQSAYHADRVKTMNQTATTSDAILPSTQRSDTINGHKATVPFIASPAISTSNSSSRSPNLGQHGQAGIVPPITDDHTVVQKRSRPSTNGDDGNTGSSRALSTSFDPGNGEMPIQKKKGGRPFKVVAGPSSATLASNSIAGPSGIGRIQGESRSKQVGDAQGIVRIVAGKKNAPHICNNCGGIWPRKPFRQINLPNGVSTLNATCFECEDPMAVRKEKSRYYSAIEQAMDAWEMAHAHSAYPTSNSIPAAAGPRPSTMSPLIDEGDSDSDNSFVLTEDDLDERTLAAIAERQLQVQAAEAKQRKALELETQAANQDAIAPGVSAMPTGIYTHGPVLPPPTPVSSILSILRPLPIQPLFLPSELPSPPPTSSQALIERSPSIEVISPPLAASPRSSRIPDIALTSVSQLPRDVNSFESGRRGVSQQAPSPPPNMMELVDLDGADTGGEQQVVNGPNRQSAAPLDEPEHQRADISVGTSAGSSTHKPINISDDSEVSQSISRSVDTQTEVGRQDRSIDLGSADSAKPLIADARSSEHIDHVNRGNSPKESTAGSQTQQDEAPLGRSHPTRQQKEITPFFPLEVIWKSLAPPIQEYLKAEFYRATDATSEQLQTIATALHWSDWKEVEKLWFFLRRRAGMGGPEELEWVAKEAARPKPKPKHVNPDAIERTTEQHIAIQKQIFEEVIRSPYSDKHHIWSSQHIFCDPINRSLPGPAHLPSAILILNQAITSKALFELVYNYADRKLVYCADGGANRLYDLFSDDDERKKFLPAKIIGDLDSARTGVQLYYGRNSVGINQDKSEYENDLGKCLSDLPLNSDGRKRRTTIIWGGLSGRFDQTIGVISRVMLEQMKMNPEGGNVLNDVRVISDNSFAWPLPPGEHIIDIHPEIFGETCGILPVNGPANVETEGLRWDFSWRTELAGDVSTSNHLVPGVRRVRIKTDNVVWWAVELQPKYMDRE